MRQVLKDLENDPLSVLPRPPGLEHPPNHPEASGSLLKKFRDPIANAEERQHLQKMLNKGHFSELRAMTRKHGGKTFLAPNVLIREEYARYFPNVIGTRLSDRAPASTADLCDNRVSLVTIIATNLAEEHVLSFTKPALAAHADDPRFRFVQINLQENKMKFYVLSLFLSHLRAQVAERDQPNYLFSAHNFEYLYGPLLMANKYVGYVFLLDPAQRIRWVGCGFATIAERENLRQCLGVLLDRNADLNPDERPVLDLHGQPVQ
ncbi:ATPase assembly factor ATP10 [Auriculariales sp. MPI-PUGE-AT-0066]|nr:ATPase assembly factor ATP10 [Auriculariales sp. MPI-PUGE-AT-0066]